MIVNMSAGDKGYIELRNGQKLWCVAILKDGELYRIRVDMAKYLEVDIQGRVDPQLQSKHDVVNFDPTMRWLEAVGKFIPTEITLC